MRDLGLILPVSTYGRVVNNGVSNPFDYGLPSLIERPSSEDISSISMLMTIDDSLTLYATDPTRESTATHRAFTSGLVHLRYVDIDAESPAYRLLPKLPEFPDAQILISNETRS